MIFGCRVCAEKDARISDARAESEWLRAELAKATDHITRIERASQGLPELAPKARKNAEPMPKGVRVLIDTWDTEATREDLERRAYRLIQRGKTWDDVKKVLEQYGGEE